MTNTKPIEHLFSHCQLMSLSQLAMNTTKGVMGMSHIPTQTNGGNTPFNLATSTKCHAHSNCKQSTANGVLYGTGVFYIDIRSKAFSKRFKKDSEETRSVEKPNLFIVGVGS